MARLDDQITFLLTCDRLKAVQRTTFLHDGTRPENSAEHSWHLALMALTLAEYASPGTDIMRVVRLLVVHDLVEVYAGDLHFAADPVAQVRQLQAEADAAVLLFRHLPPAQATEFHALQAEFNASRTIEAQFARALDALQPMLLTWANGGPGCADREPDLTINLLLHLKERRLKVFPELWQLAQSIMNQAVAAGTLPA